MSAKTMLMVTTERDPSQVAFFEAAEIAGLNIDQLYYDKFDRASLKAEHYDFIYFRDPFNVGQFAAERIESVIASVARRYSGASFVDDTSDFYNVSFEDKWRQYELLSDFMPQTNLLKDKSDFEPNQAIAKPRISSRGRGIAFSAAELRAGQSYIVQPLLDIKTEYRLYGIHGKIKKLAAIRTPKGPTSRVKISGLDVAPRDVMDFVKKIYRLIPEFQLVGFDIARLASGDLALIEVNRSPQFNRYNEITGKNLANDFVKGLIWKNQ